MTMTSPSTHSASRSSSASIHATNSASVMRGIDGEDDGGGGVFAGPDPRWEERRGVASVVMMAPRALYPLDLPRQRRDLLEPFLQVGVQLPVRPVVPVVQGGGLLVGGDLLRLLDRRAAGFLDAAPRAGADAGQQGDAVG